MSPALLLAVGAFALIAVATFQFAAVGVHRTRVACDTRRHRASELHSLRQAAEIARLNSELHFGQPSLLNWRVMEVAEIVQESEDCRSFYLVDAYGQDLPDFRPGQYLMVRPALAGAYQTTRCYSLSSSPNPNYWRITVKLQPASEEHWQRHREGGLSQWLHHTIREGDCLLVGGPNGQFFLAEDCPRPLVLIAAGVGITPMTSMLRWSLENTPARPVSLFYQAKDLQHWPLGKCLHQWQQQFPNLQVATYFSRLQSQDIPNDCLELPGICVAGKFDYRDVTRALDAPSCEYFLCGPEAWMNRLRDGLISAGADNATIHWESFGGVANQPNPVAGSVGNPLSVRFEHSQINTQWSDPGQSLWELARENRVEIPSGCLRGVCGCCRVQLISGEVEYVREISVDLSENECLACVAKPKSPVVIDA